jgi:hypothetical protein
MARRRARNYHEEYVRRTSAERMSRLGITKRQARGHPGVREPLITETPKARRKPAGFYSPKAQDAKEAEDRAKLQAAYEDMTRGVRLRDAARRYHVSDARLSRFVGSHKDASRTSVHRPWTFKTDQAIRKWWIYTNGKDIEIETLGGGGTSSSSTISRYMWAVQRFLEHGNAAWLEPYSGRKVTDRFGKSYTLETRSNVLRRLDAKHDWDFEEIYALVGEGAA